MGNERNKTMQFLFKNKHEWVDHLVVIFYLANISIFILNMALLSIACETFKVKQTDLSMQGNTN